MTAVVFHPDADAEVDSEAAYYDSRSPGRAAHFRAAVEAAVQTVLAQPNAHPKYPKTSCRTYILPRPYPFTLIYKERPADLIVYALAHHKRKPGYWKYRLRRP